MWKNKNRFLLEMIVRDSRETQQSLSHSNNQGTLPSVEEFD